MDQFSLDQHKYTQCFTSSMPATSSLLHVKQKTSETNFIAKEA